MSRRRKRQTQREYIAQQIRLAHATGPTYVDVLRAFGMKKGKDVRPPRTNKSRRWRERVGQEIKEKFMPRIHILEGSGNNIFRVIVRGLG